MDETDTASRSNQWFRVLVVVAAIVGLVLRLWNVDFDQRQHQHPDERFWAITADALAKTPAPAPHSTVLGPALDWLDGQRSPSNPYRVNDQFLYGPISLTMARSVSGWLHDGVEVGTQPASLIAHGLNAVGVPLIDDVGRARFDHRYQVDLVGRVIGALLDTLTIVVIAAIGRRLGGATAGVIAAGLYALCVLSIQYSHFLGSEPLVGLGSALTVLATLRLDRSASSRHSWRTGLMVGAAGGLALAAKLSTIGVVAVPAIGVVLLLWRYRRRSDVVRIGGMGIGALVTFRVLEPSAFNGLGMGLSADFLDDVRRLPRLTSATWPPSFQWVGRTPVLQPLLWLGRFTLGPGALLAFGLGASVMALHRWGGRCHRGQTFSGFMSPAGRWASCTAAAAVALPFVYVTATAWPTGRYFYPMLPAFYAIAGLGVAATLRFARRAPRAGGRAAAAVALVAVGLSAVWGVGFVHGVYGADNTRIAASRWIAKHVPAKSVVSAEAWDDSLPLSLPGIDASAYRIEQLNLVDPDSVSKTAKLADQLSGIDYVIESSPRIWGVVRRMPARFPSTIAFFDALDTGRAGFQRVATFRSGIQVGPWRLGEVGAEEAFSVYDHPEVRIWQKVRTVERAELLDALDIDGAATAVAVDPNRGAANGLTLTPDELRLNASGPTYNDAFSVNGSGLFHAFGFLVLVELFGAAAFVLCFPLLRRLPDAGLGVSKILGLLTMALATFISAAWLGRTLDRGLIALLASAFVAAAGRRAWSRRIELAELWRARRRIFLCVEALTVACFVALVLLRAANPDLWHPNRSGEKPFELTFLTAVLRSRTLPVYDPWFSGGALNYYYGGWYVLMAPARLLRTTPGLVLNLGIAVVGACGAGSAFTLGSALAGGFHQRWRDRARSARSAIRGGFLATFFVLFASNAAIVPPLWRKVTGHFGTGRLDWWVLSRVIPDSVAITEFPAWSLLFADLHPHLMDIPIILAVGVLAWAWHDVLVAADRRRDAVLLGAALGVVVGFVRMTNTWDFPLVLVLVGSAVAVAGWRRSEWRPLAIPVATFVAVVVIVFWPYVRRGEVFDAGFDPAELRTPAASWLRHYGLFVALSALVVFDAASAAVERSRRRWRRITTAHIVVFAAVVAELAYTLIRPAFAVFQLTASLAFGCACVAWQRRKTEAGGLAAVGPMVLALGWIIQAAVEVVTVRNDGGRMNTVFKFWYQSWLVLAIGSAVVVSSHLARRAGLRRVALAFVAIAGFLSCAFWWWATPARLEDRLSAPSLSLAGDAVLSPSFAMEVDGQRFVLGDDVALADWLRANVAGIHPIAEAPGVDYRWTSRMSWLTGLPSPIGWPYHERQQRRAYDPAIDKRVADLTTLYTTTNPSDMARVLATYRIEYVVFGTQERLIASAAASSALRTFECLDMRFVADRSAPTGPESGAFFVAAVDHACVTRLRPLPTVSSG